MGGLAATLGAEARRQDVGVHSDTHGVRDAGRFRRSYYHAWRSAVLRAAVQRVNGCEVVARPALLRRVAYDFRRTAVRNLEKGGPARSR
jgi:hypothetical protein